MMIKFTLPITCSDERCSEAILNLCEQKLGVKLMGRTGTDDVEGHISISHTPNNHQVWCFVYDNDGKHESESLVEEPVRQGETYISTRKNPLNPNEDLGLIRKIVLQDNPRVKKPITMPDSTKQNLVKTITKSEVDAEVARIPRVV